jgi:tetratricopeptide (TPR) repeat protein
MVLTLALAFGALTFTSLTLAPETAYAAEEEKEQKPRRLSSKVQRALKAAQDAMQKEDWETARAKVAEAEAVEKRNDFDNFQIDEFKTVLAIRGDDLAGAAQTIERMLASGYMTPEQETERLGHLTRIYSRLENYDKALEYGKRWQEASDGTNLDAQLLIADANYRKDNFDAAIAEMKKAMEIAKTQNEPVKEPWLQILLHSYAQKEDEANVEATLEELVRQFPKEEYWQQLLGTLHANVGADDRLTLATYRLMNELGVLQTPDDYVEMAELANEQGLPGEAVKVMDQGFGNKVLEKSRDVARVKQRQEEFRKLAAGDRKQLASDEKEAQAAKTGEPDAAVGQAYLSYDQYDKAVEALQRAVQKGGLKRPDEAQIALGRALLKLNRTDEAIQAFQAVAQGSKLAKIARLWALYAQQKGGAAPAPAPAAGG